MFAPKYRITEHCLSCIDKIAGITEKIASKKVKFSVTAKLQKEALDRNVHSSTSIEGNRLTLSQVSALNEKKEVSADFYQKQEVVNYSAALRWIMRREQRPIAKKDILYLHAVIVKNMIADQKSGCFRKKQNYIVDGKNNVVYTPPPPGRCSKLVEELVSWVDTKKKVHPILRSAIFHHQLVTIHPFSDGNGRLARAVSLWVLYKNGFDLRHLLSLDDFYAEDRKIYYQKIQQARDLDYDLTYWIDYVSEGVLKATKQAYDRVRALSYTSDKEIIVTPKQEEMIRVLGMYGSLGSAELCTKLKINRARVNQLILPLIKAKIVSKEGKSRATRYYLG